MTLREYGNNFFVKWLKTEWWALLIASAIVILAILYGYHDAKVLISYIGLSATYITGRSYVKAKGGRD